MDRPRSSKPFPVGGYLLRLRVGLALATAVGKSLLLKETPPLVTVFSFLLLVNGGQWLLSNQVQQGLPLPPWMTADLLVLSRLPVLWSPRPTHSGEHGRAERVHRR